jgi:hypothetical protein
VTIRALLVALVLAGCVPDDEPLPVGCPEDELLDGDQCVPAECGLGLR